MPYLLADTASAHVGQGCGVGGPQFTDNFTDIAVTRPDSGQVSPHRAVEGPAMWVRMWAKVLVLLMNPKKTSDSN
jgi:hypothetical protein